MSTMQKLTYHKQDTIPLSPHMPQALADTTICVPLTKSLILC